MVNKTVLTVIVSIILTVILVSLANVGASIILERPDYDDYCHYDSAGLNESDCLAKNGTWIGEENIQEDENFKTISISRCSWDYTVCQKEYEEVAGKNNQQRYYLFAGVGFALLLVGLFSKENMIQ